MRMPQRIGFLSEVWNWVNSNTPLVSAAILAFVAAIARSRKEGETFKNSFLEAFLCGLLSLGIVSAFEFIGLSPVLATLFGVMIGFLGTKKIAAITDSFIGRKLGGGNGN